MSGWVSPGIMRASYTNLDKAIWHCPELWITPEFIDSAPKWRIEVNHADPLTDDSPWKIGLDIYIGHTVIFEHENWRAIWTITDVDHKRNVLLAKWPD
jgi:hypothetical protein